VAIPSLIAYSSFDKKVDNLILEMEKYSMSLLNKMYSAKNVGEAMDSDRK
jgi:biopolymer transport protein ExbB